MMIGGTLRSFFKSVRIILCFVELDVVLILIGVCVAISVWAIADLSLVDAGLVLDTIFMLVDFVLRYKRYTLPDSDFAIEELSKRFEEYTCDHYGV